MADSVAGASQGAAGIGATDELVREVKQAALAFFRNGDGPAFEATICNVLWRAALPDSSPAAPTGPPKAGPAQIQDPDFWLAEMEREGWVGAVAVVRAHLHWWRDRAALPASSAAAPDHLADEIAAMVQDYYSGMPRPDFDVKWGDTHDLTLPEMIRQRLRAAPAQRQPDEPLFDHAKVAELHRRAAQRQAGDEPREGR